MAKRDLTKITEIGSKVILAIIKNVLKTIYLKKKNLLEVKLFTKAVSTT